MPTDPTPTPIDQPTKATLIFILVLVLAGLGLGGWTFWKTIQPKEKATSPVTSKSQQPGVTEHPVTTKMIVESKKSTAVQAPPFSATATDGKTYTLAEATADRPLLLVFIKDECPCTEIAQPYFNRLAEAFGSKVQFLGVIDADLPTAKQWHVKNKAAFPVLSVPDESAMQQYKALNGAFNALILPDGTIETMWPGYSRSMLQTLSNRLAELSGIENTLTWPDAPADMWSGCEFQWAEPEPQSPTQE